MYGILMTWPWPSTAKHDSCLVYHNHSVGVMISSNNRTVLLLSPNSDILLTFKNNERLWFCTTGGQTNQVITRTIPRKQILRLLKTHRPSLKRGVPRGIIKLNSKLYFWHFIKYLGILLFLSLVFIIIYSLRYCLNIQGIL